MSHAASSENARPEFLRLNRVRKQFGEAEAVRGVDLTIREGEFFSLLGPSGCGKTTLLRMLAGFETPTSGTIEFRGRDVSQVPPEKRPFNLVFQRYALFPHLTIEQNVAFGLEVKKVPHHEIQQRVKGILDLVRMGALAKRRIDTLSGGQQQRIALARALVNRPSVLLLDEPLSALDLKLRREMQVELVSLQRKLRHTFIFVTHDQEEALTLSDRIAVMNGGVVEQLGTAEEIYENPKTLFVAKFIGSMNVLHGRVAERGAQEWTVITPGTEPLKIRPAKNGVRPLPPQPSMADGQGVHVLVRPEKMRLSKARTIPGQNHFSGKIAEVIYQGPSTLYLVRQEFDQAPSDHLEIWVSETNASSAATFGGPGFEDFRLGDAVTASWSPEDTIVLAEER